MSTHATFAWKAHSRGWSTASVWTPAGGPPDIAAGAAPIDAGLNNPALIDAALVYSAEGQIARFAGDGRSSSDRLSLNSAGVEAGVQSSGTRNLVGADPTLATASGTPDVATGVGFPRIDTELAAATDSTVVATAATPTLTTLVSFDGTNGQNPSSDMIADAAGDLFGVAFNGGTSGDGEVFEIAKTATGYASTPTVLASFNLADGQNPEGTLIADAAGDLFGVAFRGGTSGNGVVFEIVKTASGYASTPTILVTFNGADGSGPSGGLIADAAGDLLGATNFGGANGDGVVFEIAKTSGGYASTPTTLFSFNGADGSDSNASLAPNAAGDLFGTSDFGGAYGDGDVFELARTASGYASTPTLLASFDGADGSSPFLDTSGPVFDAAGDLFGTTQSGGAYGDGTVFELPYRSGSYASTPITLVSFDGTDGQTPESPLTIDAAGDLFGTTYNGGASGDGTVFEIPDRNGSYASTPTTLATFNGANGQASQNALIANAAGDLFGTTLAGGAHGDGTMFELSGTGFVTRILATYTWASGASGDWTAASDWTPAGGPPDSTADAALIDAAGTYTVGIASGESFTANQLTLNDASAVLSVAGGGSLGLGGSDPTFTISAGTLDLAGTLIDSGALAIIGGGTLELVSGAVISATPQFFGGTEIAAGGYVVSSATVAGGVLAELVASSGGTADSTIVSGGGSEIVASGGTASGVTIAGGLLDVQSGAILSGAITFVGGGTLEIDGKTPPTNTISGFAIGDTIDLTALPYNSGGSATLLAGNTLEVVETGASADLQLDPAQSFSNVHFQLAKDASGSGTDIIFPAPTLTTLVSFDGANGNGPVDAGLSVDAAGDLFGTTFGGGAYGDGEAFEIVKTASGYASTPTVLVSFNGTDGENPEGGPLIDADGNLLGITFRGGNGNGLVFEIAKTASGYASTPTILFDFNGADGSGPNGGLIADPAGDLFGMTNFGGANDDGVVFEIAKTASGYASQPTTLFSFNDTDGYNPGGTLIANAAGDLFGVSAFGGNGNYYGGDGTVFELVKTATGYASAPTVLVTFNGADGATGRAFKLTIDAAGDLFGTTQLGGAKGDGTVFEIPFRNGSYASTPITLLSFDGANGSEPECRLIMDAAGNLFGTTSEGGANGDGTAFEIAKTARGYASTPTILATFNGANGAYSFTGLIADPVGDLIGTTSGGGPDGDGTVFELSGTGFVTTVIPTYAWASGVSGDWGQAVGWTPAGGPPNATSEAALIDAAGTYTVGIASGESFVVNRLTLDDAGATLRVKGGGTLDLGGSDSTLTISAGTLGVAGGSGGAGGTLAIGSGGALFDGGDLVVSAGGSLIDGGALAILAGGTLGLFGGAVLSGTPLFSGGTEFVAGGYTLADTTVAGGALAALIVGSDGVADATMVQSGGTEIVSAGGVASGGTVFGSGTVLVQAGGIAEAVGIAAGGTLVLGSHASGSGLDFVGGGGTLVVASGASAVGALGGVVAGDTVDLQGLAWASGASARFLAGNVLAVSAGGRVTDLVVDSGQSIAGMVPQVASDGSGGSLVTFFTGASAGQTLDVSAGETLSPVTVLAGGKVVVQSGGLVGSVVVSSGGQLSATAGGVAQDVTVRSGGSIAAAGGSIVGAVLSSGAQEGVGSGGVASDTVVAAGGTLALSGGAILSGAPAFSGGTEVVAGGYVLSGASVAGAALATLIVSSGGTADATTVLHGGTEVVAAGGVASGSVVSSGGTVQVLGGVEQGTQVWAGGTDDVGTGKAVDTVLLRLGEQSVSAGGIAIGTKFKASGAAQIVSSGGVASATFVGSGGTQTVVSGGTAEATWVRGTGVVNAGGTLMDGSIRFGVVSASGLVSAVGVLAGGTLLDLGGTAAHVAVGGPGGTEIVLSGGIASSGWVGNGGTIAVGAGGTVDNARIHPGGLVDLSSGATGSGLTFWGSGSELLVGNGATAGVVSGLYIGDTVDLRALAWASGASATFLPSHVLAVSAGGAVFDLDLDLTRNYATLMPDVASDGSGGTMVTFSATVPHGGAMLAGRVVSAASAFLHS